jgi:hypothetical protein
MGQPLQVKFAGKTGDFPSCGNENAPDTVKFYSLPLMNRKRLRLSAVTHHRA